MSSFSDMMFDDGFTDPQEYMDYLEQKAIDFYNEDTWNFNSGGYDEYDGPEFDYKNEEDIL